jgi:formylglycine-generating enzyme required for sulfatase activity
MNGSVYYNLIGMKFLLIPGGRFQMGADDIDEDSRPVHWVRVSPFWLGETPVTNQQYEVFLRATGYRKPAYWRAQGFSEAKKPVVGVNWYDATAFCEWLTTNIVCLVKLNGSLRQRVQTIACIHGGTRIWMIHELYLVNV